jgi:orotidine-5'-phosphate decarboxylase
MPNLDDATKRIALPLDVPDLNAAQRLIEQTKSSVGTFKVGLELYTAHGPSAVQLVRSAAGRCFLDLKLHDIPATMGRAVARARDLGVDYLTVHAAAGKEALAAAQEAAGPVRLLAVTVLTSLDDAALAELGLQGSSTEVARRMARLAWEAGVHGFVSSPQECAQLKEALGPEAFVVTPGIRPWGTAQGDQRRFASPAQAIANGSDMLVVGRPIRDAADPGEAARRIALEVQAALSQ